MSDTFPIKVERARLDDVERITPLFDAYRQFYKQPGDVDAARKFLTDRLAHGQSVVFFASAGERTLGFTQLYPSYSSVSLKRLWILNDIFVAPAARKHSVAAALLQRARDFAIETEAKGLILETARDNFAAQQAYERSGWIREEEFFAYYLNVP
jgi:GNAT superfamily N-acetyltransferase